MATSRGLVDGVDSLDAALTAARAALSVAFAPESGVTPTAQMAQGAARKAVEALSKGFARDKVEEKARKAAEEVKAAADAMQQVGCDMR